METTVCPWCHTEIVWDEELGPEDVCPHCFNELNEYRTLNIQLDSDDEQEKEQESEEEEEADPFWEHAALDPLPSYRALDKYGESHDLMKYEAGVEEVLDQQEEAPECPYCHEYMLLTGEQEMTEPQFRPAVHPTRGTPIIHTPFKVQVYICSGCFNVHYSLKEDDRLKLIEGLSAKKD